MGLRFASLGSGSRGNATLIEAGATRVLVDCGFSLAETRRRLARLALTPADLDAILVTHEHGDHVRGVERLARAAGCPVWCTPGTSAALGEPFATVEARFFSSHAPFRIGTLDVAPVPVPHDAREPAQFVFGYGGRRLGVLTDLGQVTEHVLRCFQGCDALVLETNHDEDMLWNGRYPPVLKQRVGGRFGHLSNRQAAAFLAAAAPERLQCLVVAHLSEKNNRPNLAVAAISRALGCDPDWVGVATQDGGCAWRSVA